MPPCPLVGILRPYTARANQLPIRRNTTGKLDRGRPGAATTRSRPQSVPVVNAAKGYFFICILGILGILGIFAINLKWYISAATAYPSAASVFAMARA